MVIEPGFCHFAGNSFPPLKVNLVSRNSTPVSRNHLEAAKTSLHAPPIPLWYWYKTLPGPQNKAIQTNHPIFLMNLSHEYRTATDCAPLPKTPHFLCSTQLLTPCVNFGMIAGYSRHPSTPQPRFSLENINLKLGTRLAISFGNMRWPWMWPPQNCAP